MHKVSAIVPPKQILHSVAKYMKNSRNSLRGKLVRNKNIVKPHFIGEAEWKGDILSTCHHSGKGGMLSPEEKFVSLLHYYVFQVNFIFLIVIFSNYFIIV